MDITQAIADQLDLIVKDAKIYRENRPQGFKEPSFYIYEIQGTSSGELMGYQFRKHLYCVMYFPDTSREGIEVREQCEIMREKLMNEFQAIDALSLKLKLLDREAKINDGALQFTFKLRFRMAKGKEDPGMQNLVAEGGLKKNG